MCRCAGRKLLVTDLQSDGGSARGSDRRCSVRRGRGERLVDEDVLAGGGASRRLLGMEMVRRADPHSLDVAVLEQVIQRLVCTMKAVLRREPVGPLRTAADRSEELGAGVLAQRGRGHPVCVS